MSCDSSLASAHLAPVDAIVRTASPMEVDCDDVCWICLDDKALNGYQLFSPCRCPRKVHAKCLARWQLQQAGRPEETHCRFCNSTLADWKTSLTPDNLKPEVKNVQPIMVVYFEGEIHRIPVKQGPDGLHEFTDRIRNLFRLPEEVDISLTFGCKEPLSGQHLKLEGVGAFDAAVHCASVAAAERQSKRRSDDGTSDHQPMGCDTPTAADGAAAAEGGGGGSDDPDSPLGIYSPASVGESLYEAAADHVPGSPHHAAAAAAAAAAVAARGGLPPPSPFLPASFATPDGSLSVVQQSLRRIAHQHLMQTGGSSGVLPDDYFDYTPPPPPPPLPAAGQMPSRWDVATPGRIHGPSPVTPCPPAPRQRHVGATSAREQQQQQQPSQGSSIARRARAYMGLSRSTSNNSSEPRSGGSAAADSRSARSGSNVLAPVTPTSTGHAPTAPRTSSLFAPPASSLRRPPGQQPPHSPSSAVLNSATGGTSRQRTAAAAAAAAAAAQAPRGRRGVAAGPASLLMPMAPPPAHLSIVLPPPAALSAASSRTLSQLWAPPSPDCLDLSPSMPLSDASSSFGDAAAASPQPAAALLRDPVFEQLSRLQPVGVDRFMVDSGEDEAVVRRTNRRMCRSGVDESRSAAAALLQPSSLSLLQPPPCGVIHFPPPLPTAFDSDLMGVVEEGGCDGLRCDAPSTMGALTGRFKSGFRNFGRKFARQLTRISGGGSGNGGGGSCGSSSHAPSSSSRRSSQGDACASGSSRRSSTEPPSSLAIVSRRGPTE